jgi:hypothetical protein
MNEITINIADSPSAVKSTFLATVQPILSSEAEDLPFEITINRYSRESWSLKQTNSSTWKTGWFKSIDEKKNINGFLKFLKERKKAAYAKFESPLHDEKTGQICSALFVVPFDQPTNHQSTKDENTFFAQYCLDDKLLKATSVNQAPKPTTKPNLQSDRRSDVIQANSYSSTASKGLLGNLIGAQRKTNQHLAQAVRKRQDTDELTDSLTSTQIISRFREKVERTLRDFENSNQTEIKIPISLAELTREITSIEEKQKVTISVLKYIVYEQVEEINEEWVATKESSGFMDESNVVVYKAGFVPPEVLEDINKGEQTDEAIQQQRFLREALSKEENRKAKLIEEQNRKKLASEKIQVAVLNTNKRDRRTIEEIQKSMMSTSKRTRND